MSAAEGTRLCTWTRSPSLAWLAYYDLLPTSLAYLLTYFLQCSTTLFHLPPVIYPRFPIVVSPRLKNIRTRADPTSHYPPVPPSPRTVPSVFPVLRSTCPKNFELPQYLFTKQTVYQQRDISFYFCPPLSFLHPSLPAPLLSLSCSASSPPLALV